MRSTTGPSYDRRCSWHGRLLWPPWRQSPRKIAQAQTKWQGKIVVSSFPRVSHQVRDSVWATRGWTYQEAIFSRRCLFFTESQVYLVCKAMMCCEAIEEPFTISDVPKFKTTKTLSLEIFDRGERGMAGAHAKNPKLSTSTRNLLEFFDHLEEYTKRHLTYDSDSLNAFRGLLAISYFHTFWGVPIARMDSDGKDYFNISFARGLWWRKDFRHGSLLRRTKFPRWSWAGWAGPICGTAPYAEWNYYIYEDYYYVDEKNFKTNFRICRTDGTPFTVGQLCALVDAQRTKIIPEIGYLLQIKAVIVKLRVEGMVRSGEKGSRIWVPRSHFPVFTCKEYSTDGDISNEIFSKVWKGVMLFKGVDTIGNPRYKIMLVEFHGGIAERVGTVELTPRDYECLPKTKKRRSIWLR
jgi:hypothetical protein